MIVVLKQVILVRILKAKNSNNQTHPTNDVILLTLLSSNLDYSHLLNYFLETNLFFNLGQMAIWIYNLSVPRLSSCHNLV